MSRPRGGIIAGTLPAWTTTSTSGVFTLREAQELQAANTWPRGPAAPTSLSASAGNAQLSLSWTAPATTNGTITNYLVEYTASGGSPQYVLTNSTSNSYTLTGLTSGTTYTVRVAAVNFTAGAYSSAVTGTPLAVTFIVIQSGWTGTGTSGNKLTPPQTGGDSNYPGSFSSASFTVGTAGTLNITPVTNDAFDGHMCRVYKNGAQVDSWVGGRQPASVTFSVVNGNIIQLTGDYGLLWNRTTRMWIA